MSRKLVITIILLLVFIATGLNFLDRQVLSVTIIRIQREFDMTDTQYGMINTAFLISYALMFTVSGRLTDRFGGKAGLGYSVLIWSVASALHSVMAGFTHLLMLRFLLGLGEGGCFPAAAKTVNELFSEKRRALANGVAIGGSAIGAVLAPPLTIYISNWLGWRWSFAIPGLFGLVWVICWFIIKWPPIREPAAKRGVQTGSFIKILKDKTALLFVLIRFLLDPVFYFLMFWAPKYLNEVKKVSFDDIGRLLWIPFLALGISNILGGYLSDALVRRGWPASRARTVIMGSAALLTTGAMLMQTASSVGWVITLMSLLAFAHGFWVTNYITSISDVFGSNGTSTVVGLSGTAGAIAGFMVNPLIGMVVQNYSYSPLWFICGIMYPVAFGILLLLHRRRNQLTVMASIV